MKKVIVFDMDDTLYDEYDFVKSGFNVVAEYLSSQYQLDKQEMYNWMWEAVLENGRGAIFDNLLKKYDLHSKTLVRKCISLYRLHKPRIHLPKNSEEVLKELSKKYSLYLVTDGNKIVQQNKVTALNLEKYMKKCYITYRYGRKHSKPSPYCFHLIEKKEKVDSSQIVYIGDNPTKDFVGIKSSGFRTIRIMTGQHKKIEMPVEYEAEIRINCITELFEALKKIWPEKEG